MQRKNGKANGTKGQQLVNPGIWEIFVLFL